MNSETFNSMIFMVFGLGFFLFVTLLLTRDSREARENRLQDAREFGFTTVNQLEKSQDSAQEPSKKE